ncbi:hypothetical protein RND81_10G083100 [Saponaria officinalis]|uniref:Uncharacterized protein n=1 Tax=Saponaria officinalis TaxID=3572 RepID=A0AAW1HZE3_SAPOF
MELTGTTCQPGSVGWSTRLAQQNRYRRCWILAQRRGKGSLYGRDVDPSLFMHTTNHSYFGISSQMGKKQPHISKLNRHIRRCIIASKRNIFNDHKRVLGSRAGVETTGRKKTKRKNAGESSRKSRTTRLTSPTNNTVLTIDTSSEQATNNIVLQPRAEEESLSHKKSKRKIVGESSRRTRARRSILPPNAAVLTNDPRTEEAADNLNVSSEMECNEYNIVLQPRAEEESLSQEKTKKKKGKIKIVGESSRRTRARLLILPPNAAVLTNDTRTEGAADNLNVCSEMECNEYNIVLQPRAEEESLS